MQAHLRKLVVKAVHGGMTQTEAAATYGVSLRAVSKWMKLSRDGGLRALKPGKRGRQFGSGRLNAKQAARIRAPIIGKMLSEGVSRTVSYFGTILMLSLDIAISISDRLDDTRSDN